MWSTPGRLESVSTVEHSMRTLVAQGLGVFYNTKLLPEPLLTPSRQLTAQCAARADCDRDTATSSSPFNRFAVIPF